MRCFARALVTVAPILLLASFGIASVANNEGTSEKSGAFEQEQAPRRRNGDRLWNAIERSLSDPDVSMAETNYETRYESCGYYTTRLPKRIVPHHYELLQKANLDKLEFEGAVRISLNVNEIESELEETKIVLHADASLEIDNVWYVESDPGESNDQSKKFHWFWEKQKQKPLLTPRRIKVREVCRDSMFQFVVVTLNERLKRGAQGKLYMTFSGKLADVPLGFFSSPYSLPAAAIIDNNNNNDTNTSQVRHIAATQFEAVEARKAFPCFDEPAMKATFAVSLIHPSDRIALSNTEVTEVHLLPEYDKTHWPERKWTRFAQTPVMSTYLVAFIVGEFKYIERIAATGTSDSKNVKRMIPVRVYLAPDEPSDRAEVSLELAVRALELATRYFDIDYPLSKLDLVAVSNYDLGAMENWGLIVIRREMLAVNEAESDPYHRSASLLSIVSEIVHQWTGNLVTMDWWDDIWLSDGLANYFGYKFAKMLVPKYNYDYRYLLYSHQTALNKDSISPDPRAIRAEEVELPEQIEELFEETTYNKAASVMRTLEHELMRRNKFRVAIRKYLKKFAYSTATTKDFVDMMRKGSTGRDVGDYLKSAIEQPGVPLIKVTYDEGKRELLMVQQRFLNKQTSLVLGSHDQHWDLPVSVVFSDGTSQLAWYGEDCNKPIKVPSWFHLERTGHWVKINAGYSGFYRADYQPEMIDAFEGPIRSKQLIASDRLNLIDDCAALVPAHGFAAKDLLKLISWFEDEDDTAVMDSLVEAFDSVLNLYRSSDRIRPQLEKFGRAFFGGVKSQFGFVEPKVAMLDDRTQYQQLINRQSSANFGLHPVRQRSSNFDRSASGSGSDSDSDNQEQSAQAGTSIKEETQVPLEGYANLLKMLVHLEHEETINDALNLFETSEQNKVNPYLRTPVYIAVSRNGSEAQFERLFEMFRASDNFEESFRLASGIAHTNQSGRLRYVWEWIKYLKDDGSHHLDQQEVLGLPRIMAASQEGREFVIGMLKQELDELIELYGDSTVSDLAVDLCLSGTLSEFDDLDAFFVKKDEFWQRISPHVRRALTSDSLIRKANMEGIESVIEKYLGRPTTE